MIGVLFKDSEARAVEEFFQLFKTQWEFWTPGRLYDLVIATGEEIPQSIGPCPLVIFHSQPIGFDAQIGVVPESVYESAWLEGQDIEFPVYGSLFSFQSNGKSLLRSKQTAKVVAAAISGPERSTVRVGFDLFSEVAFLLTHGQPAENAGTPTLDIHISLLRSIIMSLDVPFIEVPPMPYGYDFMGCLTHDVDFVGIRDHKFDHTMWGFLYRSLIGSFRKALTGRLQWSKCLQNWAAALSLPLVHLGLRQDFWLEFDRYREIEREFGSTFFFIPFKDAAGKLGCASAPQRRAAKYELGGIKNQITELVEAGCEVGLHGIDAWRDVQSAQSERARICEVTGRANIGTRMHWLYWNENSPKVLEDAGLTYDSTFGYNDAVGFRAGTAQAYRPLNAEHLLELPLTIQDSAMFYSDRMMLSESEALNICKDLLRTMSTTGGAVTVNWHTRSLSPERLWADFYRQLLNEIRAYRVWFGTAQEVVDWFRKRRALRFDSVQFKDDRMRIALNSPVERANPPLAVRIHYRRFPLNQTDIRWNGEDVLKIACSEFSGSFASANA
ncbi:MAG: hypothetical protein WBE76_27020 [Terracidiphilus sp.]